ncbi:MAG: hypothetical protein KAJ49_06260 [Arcobacteraceae bacterium]|nr:hypothetical protein [Arcobacteraceae bacterium]
MTNTQTIEKLNEGLIQLIEAYEILQEKNTKLEEEINSIKAQNVDLEYKLSDFSNNNDAQTSKMDGMLSKIQTLLKPSFTAPIVEEVAEEVVAEEETFDLDISVEQSESILDIKLDNDTDSNSIKDDFNQESTNKIDLGRMESLLNGLNNR